ncbi:YczE/YyaS/YitT family protein [Anaerobium acetethylicum]|uniref:Membrane protein YczE n=1 Tax=Anaerobium acetethylicum TaxID=1619234 RepID=A0A1D3TTK3_9FIRM|nr:hypothetical protein [Anaerobium acetethylicum]SCP97261.1 hypothetical protein SAMN05421730_100974 [Anaerobium acetethylicum]
MRNDRMKIISCLKRAAAYILGVWILALGQRMFVVACFGAGSLDAFCVGLADRTALTAGQWVAVSAFVMMLISAVLLRRKPDFLVLLSSYIFGLFFDFWGGILAEMFGPMGFLMRLIVYFAALLLAPFGTAVYFSSNFSKSAFDEFIMAVKERFNLSVRKAKIIVDVIFCILAFVVGGPLGPATVITAALFGPILQGFMEIHYKARLRKKLEASIHVK